MKFTPFKIVVAINIAVLAFLFAAWWANGKDDTWLYITCAIISLSGLISAIPRKKAE